MRSSRSETDEKSVHLTDCLETSEDLSTDDLARRLRDTSMASQQLGQDDDNSQYVWEDLLGTGTVMKQVLIAGNRSQEDLDMEAPRKFFALIDIETKCNDRIVKSDSHKNYLINVDADLFPGAHLVIPLMDIGETSRYIFHSKFGYAECGNLPDIPANAKLECIITLKLRSSYDDFLSQLSTSERIKLANRKKDRGKFWYSRSNYQNAITIYQSLADLCHFSQCQEDCEAC